MARHRSKVQRQWSYANVKLDKAQKAEFLIWQEGFSADLLETLPSILLADYKLSAKHDVDNSTWICSLTGGENNPDNAYTSMSARHTELEVCLALVIYKHMVICEGGGWEVQADEDSWG